MSKQARANVHGFRAEIVSLRQRLRERGQALRQAEHGRDTAMAQLEQTEHERDALEAERDALREKCDALRADGDEMIAALTDLANRF